tara:strand:- start:73 stop:714 length:642 start_codon:yes stop_codon:yes gene_type:complete
MQIEKLSNNIWVPSNDAQIQEWRDQGYPFMQERCLNSLTKWCELQNKKFKCVLDIGAWCGTWSMAMQKFAKNIKCFEPNKTHFECLTRNVAPYNHVNCYNQAIGNQNGYIKLSQETATQNTRVLQEKGDVPIYSLDKLAIPDVDFIKIDVEGFEMEVLQGASETLNNISYLMIELNNNSKKYGSNNIEIEKHLNNLGFKILFKVWPDTVYYRI